MGSQRRRLNPSLLLSVLGGTEPGEPHGLQTTQLTFLFMVKEKGAWQRPGNVPEQRDGATIFFGAFVFFIMESDATAP